MCVWQVLCHCSQDVMRLMLWFKLYRTILYVTDVMSPQALMLLACYLSLTSGEFISTSSHISSSSFVNLFMGCPRFRRVIPLRPIVSSRGTNTYEIAKELARILRLLVGRSPYHIRNTKNFVDQIQGIQLQERECVNSFHVSTLFTLVPTDPAISILKRKLEQDQGLHVGTSMTVQHVISLLEFCLRTTYF